MAPVARIPLSSLDNPVRDEREQATPLVRPFGVRLAMFAPVRWVNHPSRVADAEFKPLQLAVANQRGLPCPRTVMAK